MAQATHALNIVRGDTFESPIFRHKDSLGAYIDTSSWTILAQLYKDNDCGAEVIVVFTVVHQPAPEYGYQLTLNTTQTEALVCASRFYDVETTRGSIVKTSLDGEVTIEGV